jgi:hypothetical protein
MESEFLLVSGARAYAKRGIFAARTAAGLRSSTWQKPPQQTPPQVGDISAA